MKHPKLLDKAVVAALLLAYVPGLAEDTLPEYTPAAALIAPLQEADCCTEENPADGL